MDIGWSELLLIGIVALIVIGPKELPGMFRELGRITAKLRAMGREFSRAMEEAGREAGVKDVAEDLKKITSPKALGLEAVKSAADKFEKWDPLKNAAKPTAPLPKRDLTPPPMPPVTPPVTPAVATATPAMGPATAALAEKQAEKRAAAAEKSAALRQAKAEAAAAAAAPAASPVKRGGRVRKSARAADSGAEE